MDKTIFSESAPGHLVELVVGGRKDWAFVPDPLPHQWMIPHDMWPLLADAREALAR